MLLIECLHRMRFPGFQSSAFHMHRDLTWLLSALHSLSTVHAWIKQTHHEPIPTAEEVAPTLVIHHCSKNQTLLAGGE